MADIKQSIPTDGIGRQEEEVRDLFNLLTQKEPAEQPRQTPPTAIVELPQESTPAPCVPETVDEKETVQPDTPAAEPTAPESIEETPIASDAPAAASELMGEPLPESEPIASPITAAPSAAHERRAPVFDDDADDIGLELPPLVLTSYDEVEDEDDADEYGQCEHFILPGDTEEDYEIDAAPVERRNPFAAFWHALCGNVPLPCDSKREIARKSVFWLSLVVIAGALTYILYNVWWLPSFTKNMYGDIAQEYHPEVVGVVSDDAYPKEMQLSFQSLYDRNNEIRGWLSFHASGNRDFLNIEYPIMYSGDNEKYLTIDFNGNKNKNGALFFDMRAKLNSAEDTNTSLIVYGHNMASGQMLAGLNKFIGNVNNARVASTMTMNTLFESGQYKVFAVIITDESAQEQHYFNVRRTLFADDEDFLTYIENLRARSLFDYPVDVQAGDELLLLSTCTVPSSAKIDNGRLTVVARKVRSGESTTVNTSAIVKNDDVIMPYAWYTLQDKQPHSFYSGGVIIAPSTTTTTTMTDNKTDWDDSLIGPEASTSASDTPAVGTTSAATPSTSGRTMLTTVPPVSGTTTSSSAATSAESTTATAESTTTTTAASTTTVTVAATTTAAESTTAATEATTTAAETTTTAAQE